MRNLHEIGIRLAQQHDQIDKGTDEKQTSGKEIQDTHYNFSLVELMGAKVTEEQTQQYGDPLILSAAVIHYAVVDVIINIGVYIVVGIVDNDIRVRLGCLLELLHLSATECADHGIHGNFSSAELAELGLLGVGIIHDSSFFLTNIDEYIIPICRHLSIPKRYSKNAKK
jgi:hypothetical protein